MASFKYQFHQLFNPLLVAMNNLGGSSSVSEMENEVAKILNLSDEQINEIHKGSRTKLSYRLAWARTYLKKYGVIDNSERGVWALTEKGKSKLQLTPQEVILYYRSDISLGKSTHESQDEENEQDKWQNELISIIQKLTPEVFERLCQRLLRELGFVNVIITGKSGDEGIDGKGILRLGGLVSFNCRTPGTLIP